MRVLVAALALSAPSNHAESDAIMTPQALPTVEEVARADGCQPPVQETRQLTSGQRKALKTARTASWVLNPTLVRVGYSDGAVKLRWFWGKELASLPVRRKAAVEGFCPAKSQHYDLGDGGMPPNEGQVE